jgi:hypothetical protein
VTSLEPAAMTVEEGFDFVLSHFEEPNWPRTIFTPKDKQVLVYDKQGALARFKRASLLDCRINAYPDYTGFGGMNRQAPNFIFIDLDLSCFSSRDSLDKALRSVLKNIKEKFNGAQATIIWSGNGYHIYLPIQAFILESESIFAEFEQPSKKFLRFAEKMLTNNRADPCHSSSLSFKNCLLRVPGSHNWECVKRNNNTFDSTTEVKVMQKWHGNRPAINWLLRDFRRALIQEKIDNYVAERKWSQFSSQAETTRRIWIEKLLGTPIEDYRKYALWRIVTPYLINIRKLSHEDALSIIREWLDKCDKLRPLVGVSDRIKANLSAAARVGYLPISFSDLEIENRELADFISCQIK